MNDAFSLPQSVLVLGGTSEIARATVRALVARRARDVVLAGRDRDGLLAAAAEATAAGATTVATLPFDATDVEHHGEVIGKAFA
ncbi:MAG: KR domain-containing protein, partial [Acidimicrobiales bacterium]